MLLRTREVPIQAGLPGVQGLPPVLSGRFLVWQPAGVAITKAVWGSGPGMGSPLGIPCHLFFVRMRGLRLVVATSFNSPPRSCDERLAIEGIFRHYCRPVTCSYNSISSGDRLLDHARGTQMSIVQCTQLKADFSQMSNGNDYWGGFGFSELPGRSSKGRGCAARCFWSTSGTKLDPSRPGSC